MGLAAYAAVFKEFRIDGSLLLELTDTDLLQDMKMPERIQRKRLLNSISKFKGDKVSESAEGQPQQNSNINVGTADSTPRIETFTPVVTATQTPVKPASIAPVVIQNSPSKTPPPLPPYPAKQLFKEAIKPTVTPLAATGTTSTTATNLSVTNVTITPVSTPNSNVNSPSVPIKDQKTPGRPPVPPLPIAAVLKENNTTVTGETAEGTPSTNAAKATRSDSAATQQSVQVKPPPPSPFASPKMPSQSLAARQQASGEKQN
jgi:hypothetical protein